MKRLTLCVLAVALMSVTAMSKTYYIPHIHTANDSWETHLLLNNTSPVDVARCTVNLYDEDGLLLMTFYPSVDPGETIDYSLRSYGGVAGTVESPADFLSVRLGFVASESSGGGTAEFYLPDQLSDAAVLNLSGYYDQLTWSGYALFNGTDEDVTITPRYFTTDGLSHSGPSILLGAMKKRVDYFNNLLSHPFEDVASVIFETDTDALAAIIISGKENEKLLFTPSDHTSDSWEVVDRYSSASMMSSFFPVGQATTSDYVLYAVDSSMGYDFNHLVKCFDRTNGELVWEVDIESEMEAWGLAASASGDYVYLYGGIISSTINWYVYCLDADTGATVNWTAYGYGGVFAYEENFKNKIHVASTGGSTLVVYQTPAGVTRLLYDEGLSTETAANTWAGVDTVVTDVVGYDGDYYLLRTDWNATDSLYNHLWLYMFPYNNLSGGGLGQPLENLRFDGTSNHAFANGLYVKGTDVYFMINVLLGNPYGGTMGYLYMSSGDLVPAQFDLSDNSFSKGGVVHDRATMMRSHATSFEGPNSQVYTGVSGWDRSTIVQAYYGYSRTYDYEFRDLSCSGDDLYIVSWDIELGDLAGSTATNVVRVRKTSFTELFTKE